MPVQARIEITVLTALLLWSHAAAQASGTTLREQDRLAVQNHDTDARAAASDSVSPGAGLDTLPAQDHNTAFSGVPVPQTSAKAKPLEADSSDTLARARQRDSILNARAGLFKAYSRYPTSLDSVFDIHKRHPFHIYCSDVASISEVLRAHPALVTVPFSLSSSLNRFMTFGLPAAHVAMHTEKTGPGFHTDATVGADILGAAEIDNATVRGDGDIRFSVQPPHLVNPHVLMLWESGVFNENSLNVRFARPIGRSVDLGAFSNYRHLQRQSYRQTSGGIYSFYSQFFEDTSLIVRNGVNPLTQEHISGVRFAWHGDNQASVTTAYRYMDMHDDIAYGQSDSLGSALHWLERSHYAHSMTAGAGGVPLWKIRTDINTYVKNEVNRIAPAHDTAGVSIRRRGERTAYGGSVRPFVALGNDTTALEYRLGREDRIRYDQTKWKFGEQSIRASHVNRFATGPVSSCASASIGYAMLRIADSLEQALVWNVRLEAVLGAQSMSVYTKRDHMPVELPYDTAFSLTPGAILDRYRHYGAQALVRYKLAGAYIGVVMTDDVDSAKIHWYWPGGMPPYAEPNRALVVAPLFGRWYGLAASSSWIFSDTRPFVKSHSTLSYESPGRDKLQRLFVDAGFTYWSERDPLTYAGIDTWNRPLYDVHARIAVQIRAFRLFYRMDNILNRKNAYVPGYFLPGLTFRWGFNWLLQG